MLRHHDAGDLVECVITALRRSFDEVERPGQAAWLFDLRNRQRGLTTPGRWAWTFAAWPLLPGLDRRVLDVCAGLPPSSLAERHIEDELLRRHHRRLAALPFDRASSDRRTVTPLVPSFREMLRERIVLQTERITNRLGRLPKERWFWANLWDCSTVEWRSLWDEAIARSDSIADVINPDVMASVIEPFLAHYTTQGPDRAVTTASQKPKLLLGLVLLAQQYPLQAASV